METYTIYRVGQKVLCPKHHGTEVMIVEKIYPIESQREQALALHHQWIILKHQDGRIEKNSISGYYLVPVESMMVYIARSSTQLSLGVARMLKADMMLAEKAGEITVAYPISDKGKIALETLGLKSHRQPEYDASYYPIPMALKDALVHLGKKFEVEDIST
jgi:hypothetical protein